jgi:hypothetical protein
MTKTTTKSKEVIAESLGEEMIAEKPYTFRRLSTQDLFPMFKVISKLGIREFQANGGIKDIALRFVGDNKDNINPTALGLDIILEIASLVIENLPKCEAEIYQLLSQTSNLSVEEIKEQDMAITFEMIIDFIKKEEFGDFFKVVSKLFK